MINLQALIEETIDFKWIDGKELHVRQPSTRFVNKVDRTENTLENAQDDDIIISAGSLYMIGHVRQLVK